MQHRRTLLTLAIGLALPGLASAQTPRAFRIGDRKSWPLLIAKRSRNFERG